MRSPRALFLAIGMLCFLGAAVSASAADASERGQAAGRELSSAHLFQFDTDLVTERTVSSEVIQVNRILPSSGLVFAAVTSVLIVTLRSRKAHPEIETPTSA